MHIGNSLNKLILFIFVLILFLNVSYAFDFGQFIDKITGNDNSIVISSNDIKNINDSDMLNNFKHIKGYKSISFDVSSSSNFNADKVEKNNSLDDAKIKNNFKLNNLEIETEYKEIDTSFFNVDSRPVKQTYKIKNLLNEHRNIKLNIRYEIDSDTITWNNTKYEIASKPRYFKAFNTTNKAFPGITYLTGYILYFGNSYYDFKDITNFDYALSVYSKRGRNYIDLDINSDINSLEEFIIDPTMGWTARMINDSIAIATISTADIDKDGDIDVVVSGRVEWYENNGSTPPHWIQRIISLNGAGDAYPADIDKDGDIDIVTANDGNTTWYENNGGKPPSWATRNISTSSQLSYGVFAIDLDNDADLDVLSTGSANLFWHENIGNSRWIKRTITSSLSDARDVYAADLDDDGDVDVLTASYGDGRVAWYENNGASPPNWTMRDITTTQSGANSVYAADINNDSNLDVLSAAVNGGVNWHENNGGSPPAWTSRGIGSASLPISAYAADIDKDGDIDVVNGGYLTSHVEWNENNGSNPPSWTNHYVFSSSFGLFGVYASDLDKDGDIDILSANRDQSEARWYESDLNSANILSLAALQVVENVDFVKNKKTLVRARINGTANTTATVKLFFNNWLKESKLVIFSTAGTQNVDFFFKPNITGNNKEIKVQVNVGSETSSTSKFVNVTQTRDLTIVFVPVDNSASVYNIDKSVKDSVDFINKTYPLSDNGLKILKQYNPVTSSVLSHTIFTLPILLNQVQRAGAITASLSGKSPDRFVGLVPEGWFSNILFLDNAGGYSPFPIMQSQAILSEDDLFQSPAHELGHSYGLCDEYDPTEWNKQNILTLFNCPNGDSDNNNALDTVCAENHACLAYSFYQLTGINDEDTLYNLMGNSNPPWIDNETFKYLLNELKKPNVESSSLGIMISGIYNKSSGIVKLDDFYILDTELVVNQSEFNRGNFSISLLDDFNNTLSLVRFSPSFIGVFDNGSTTELNVTSFIFVLPYSEDVKKIIFKQNETIKEEVARTINSPQINILTNLTDKHYSDSLFTISWNSSDIDSNNLSYTVLMTTNNGTTFSTSALDYKTKNITLNSSLLPDCESCRIRVLATDGVNTNSSMSDIFSIDNNLQISDLDIIYINNTQRIFRFVINNSYLSKSIDNINWTLDTGQTVLNSKFKINLTASEDIFLYVYYNYTFLGNYTIIATAFNNNYLERKSLKVRL